MKKIYLTLIISAITLISNSANAQILEAVGVFSKLFNNKNKTEKQNQILLKNIRDLSVQNSNMNYALEEQKVKKVDTRYLLNTPENEAINQATRAYSKKVATLVQIHKRYQLKNFDLRQTLNNTNYLKNSLLGYKFNMLSSVPMNWDSFARKILGDVTGNGIFTNTLNKFTGGMFGGGITQQNIKPLLNGIKGMKSTNNRYLVSTQERKEALSQIASSLQGLNSMLDNLISVYIQSAEIQKQKTEAEARDNNYFNELQMKERKYIKTKPIKQ